MLANILGYALSLYQQWWWFDRTLHAFTLASMTFWLGLYLTREILRPDRARSLPAYLVVLSVGVALGAIWEVAE